MKRLFLSLLLTVSTMTCMQAQQVYNEIRQKAANTVSDPQTNDVVRQISRFKVNTLDYMAMKMREQMPDSSVTFLDRQALALNNYISLYMQTLVELRDQPQKYQAKIMRQFIDATITYPLFNDRDEDVIYAYIADESCITRFSINTDWCKAYATISMTLKKQK